MPDRSVSDVNANPDTQMYLGHPFTVFGLQAFLGLLEVSVFVVVPGRFEVPVHGVWRTGGRGGYCRRAKKEESNIGQRRKQYDVRQGGSKVNTKNNKRGGSMKGECRKNTYPSASKAQKWNVKTDNLNSV